MNTVVLEVRSLAETLADAAHAMKTGKGDSVARIGFSSPELLWQVLTAKRWSLLKAMCGAGPMPIREAARRVERDVKAVHSDVTALLEAGILSRAQNGQVEFPFDSVKVEFLLQVPPEIASSNHGMRLTRHSAARQRARDVRAG